MTEQYTALIERLEKTNGQDRDLDARICYAVKPALQRMGSLDEWLSTNAARVVPTYTWSIDDALTLVPDHHLWQVKQGIEASAVVWMLETDYDGRNPPMGYSTTFPAIALTIAALRARAEREARTHGQSPGE